jgi:amino acid adenylation domain-containing protein
VSSETSAAAPRVSRPEASPSVLSFAQERLWLLHHLEPRDTAYHVPLVARLRGPLSRGALRQALTEVARRHTVLRTVYPMSAGRPRAEVRPPGALPLPLIDLAALAIPARERMVAQLVRADLWRPFDLGDELPLRATLLRTARDDHRLLLTRHHIATDGWSLGPLLTELTELYAAFTSGAGPVLAEPALQYADVAAGERASPPDQEALSWWVESLAGAPQALEFVAPVLREGPAPPASRLRAQLEPHHLTGVDRLARTQNTTRFVVLLAAYAAVLSQLSSQEDVVIGTPVAGRQHPGHEGLIGTFVNMLPLRVHVGRDPEIADLIRRAHDVAVGGLDRQHVPLERIIEMVQPIRDLTRSPLFQAVLALQSAPVGPLAVPGFAVTLEQTPPVAPKYALTVTATPAHGSLELLLEHDPDAVSADLAERVLTGLISLLAAAPSAARARCSALTAVAPAGSGVAAGRDGVLAESPPARLEDRFAAVAAARPDAVAVQGDGELITYGALARRAGRLAHALRARGCGPEQVVAIWAERRPDTIVAIIGVLLSGAAYLPLDPHDPAQRHAELLADSGARLAVAPRAALLPVPTVPIDEPGAWEGEGPSTPRASPASAAYVIYTSGSTGVPKGVVVTHANVSQLLDATAELAGAGPDSRWSLSHSFSFDFSVWELWGALAHGGCVVVMPDAVRKSPDELSRAVRSWGITHLSQTPTSFTGLAARMVTDGGSRAVRPPLARVFLGGEACSPAALAPWFSTLGDERPEVVNLYGITETTVHVTARRVRVEDVDGRARSPIGAALPGMGAVAVDRWGGRVPVGGRGELIVTGPGVARGYLGRPGLTAERFRPAAAAGARGYRTGDIARLLSPHELDYLGRDDRQLKLRGYRIEPAEIEAALLRHAGVAGAVVLLREPDAREARPHLAAYVVPAAEWPEPEELREYLRHRLPPHMVPGHVMLLERLPMTANGKLDLGRLPRAEPVGLPQREDDEPRSPTEHAIAGLWRELLGIEHVGRRENFFDLGGDSLDVAQFHARLPAVVEVEIPMRRLFSALDVASLAEVVEELRASAEARLEELIAEVEALDDAEVRRRLA